MRCTRCGRELRIATEQVGVDANGLPVFHRHSYCDNCKMKWDIDIAPPQNADQYHQTNQHNNYGNFQGGYQGNMSNTPRKVPFWNKAWFVILMSIFLPPIGLILLWVTKKPRNMIARIVLTVVLILYSLVWIVGVTADTGENSIEKTQKVDKENESVAENNSDGKQESTEQITPDEYKSQCIELDYEGVARNPDEYIGTKFKVTAEIFSVSQGSWGSGTYYKVFTDDGSGAYFDNMIWVFDKRDEESEDYVKLLEDDIVTFYGEFNGMQETKNYINGEKGEDIALDIYYIDLIEQ